MSDAIDNQDKLLACVDCGAQFIFTARDQAFYQENNYQAPRRCKTCRGKRKLGQPANPAHSHSTYSHAPHSHAEEGAKSHRAPNHFAEPASGTTQKFKVTCSGCGAEATVPFKPNPNRPVYCRTCYQAHKGASQPSNE